MLPGDPTHWGVGGWRDGGRDHIYIHLSIYIYIIYVYIWYRNLQCPNHYHHKKANVLVRTRGYLSRTLMSTFDRGLVVCWLLSSHSNYCWHLSMLPNVASSIKMWSPRTWCYMTSDTGTDSLSGKRMLLRDSLGEIAVVPLGHKDQLGIFELEESKIQKIKVISL